MNPLRLRRGLAAQPLGTCVDDLVNLLAATRVSARPPARLFFFPLTVSGLVARSYAKQPASGVPALERGHR